ncbi:MAG: hypothetical protein V4695_08500 [Pseudomonadota bacterium]
MKKLFDSIYFPVCLAFLGLLISLSGALPAIFLHIYLNSLVAYTLIFLFLMGFFIFIVALLFASVGWHDLKKSLRE